METSTFVNCPWVREEVEREIRKLFTLIDMDRAVTVCQTLSWPFPKPGVELTTL